MIWYLDHSAIAVETNNHLLLFDLFGKTLQPPKGMGLAQRFVNPDELRDKDVVIFVSHEHPDHFDPAIFSLRDRLKRVRFVLPEEFDEIYQGDLFAAPNQTYRLPDMTVTTFESTDIGLAYLVEVDDKRIYHAGDLNWWHWEGEEEEFNLDQAKRYQQQLQLLGISEDTFDSINRMYLLYARIHDLYTADGSAMHPTQEAIDAFAQEKGYVTVKLLYWPASGGENSQAQAQDFAARLSTAEDKDALYAEMAQQLGIEAGDTGRTFSAETLGDTLSAAFSALEPGQVSDVIATDEGWYVAIGQTLDESSVLDEMFTENVTQARSELTVEYNQGLYDKLDAGDFYSRLTARQSELSSQFSSGSADPGTDSGTGSSTDSDTSGEKEGGSTGSGD